MGFYFDKQPSSRVIKTQTIAYTGAGTAVSTNFTPQTYQLRISRCARIRRKLCYLKRLGGGWPGGPTRRCKRASGKKQSGPFQSSSARARRPRLNRGKISICAKCQSGWIAQRVTQQLRPRPNSLPPGGGA